MQPDPQVFLPAIRHEVIHPDLFGPSLAGGLAPILMMRAGEGLAQLELRRQRLPEILRRLRPQQRALLETAVKSLTSLGITLPPLAARALQTEIPPGEPGEEDVRFFDSHVDAISACIAALGATATPQPRIDAAARGLCASASRLEFDMRRAYQTALDELKADLERIAQDAAPPRPAAADAQLTAVLRTHFPEHAAIAAKGLQLLAGVNAQEIYFFELLNHPQWAGPSVLRRASAYNPTQASLADEFDLLNTLHAQGLPVAKVLMAERDASKLGSGFIIMQRLAGKPQTPASIGEHGPAIMRQMAAILARIHSVDAKTLSAPHRDSGKGVVPVMQGLIDRFYSRWLRERVDGSMALESAFTWLRMNSAALDDRVSLVHGDCNLRNILIDGGRVSALLDWELSHAGHAAEDLAYIRPDVEAIMPWADFLAAYIAAGGKPVSEQSLRYFSIWRDVWRTSMAACIYGAFIRGEHRNFIFGTVSFHEYYTTLDTLVSFMAREAYV